MIYIMIYGHVESRWGQIAVLYNPTQSTTINKHAGFAPIHRLKHQLIPDSEVIHDTNVANTTRNRGFTGVTALFFAA